MGRLKLVAIILIGLLTLITLIIGVKQPTLHKQTMFTDEYHTFVEEDIPTSSVGFSNVDTTPVSVGSIDPVQSKTVEQPIMTVETPNQPAQNKTNVQTQSPIKAQKPVQKPVQKTIQTPKKQEVKQTPTHATVQQPISTKKHVLTEEEEIIAWNKWRSNLQNQVMRDSSPMTAPLGTIFKFSFTVDKYGNMSNIKVWSPNSNYTDYGVRKIKPVLTSYNHKAILNFPMGTKRVITNVSGGFIISRTAKYSTPEDYSDYEKVKRYK